MMLLLMMMMVMVMAMIMVVMMMIIISMIITMMIMNNDITQQESSSQTNLSTLGKRTLGTFPVSKLHPKRIMAPGRTSTLGMSTAWDFWPQKRYLAQKKTCCVYVKYSSSKLAEKTYPLVNMPKTMENHHLQWIFPWTMVIFHSFWYVYQTVNHHEKRRNGQQFPAWLPRGRWPTRSRRRTSLGARPTCLCQRQVSTISIHHCQFRPQNFFFGPLTFWNCVWYKKSGGYDSMTCLYLWIYKYIIILYIIYYYIYILNYIYIILYIICRCIRYMYIWMYR